MKRLWLVALVISGLGLTACEKEDNMGPAAGGVATESKPNTGNNGVADNENPAPDTGIPAEADDQDDNVK